MGNYTRAMLVAAVVLVVCILLVDASNTDSKAKAMSSALSKMKSRVRSGNLSKAKAKTGTRWWWWRHWWSWWYRHHFHCYNGATKICNNHGWWHYSCHCQCASPWGGTHCNYYPCHLQLTCQHGGSLKRQWSPPQCDCNCIGIWYGRDCSLELQRDCFRAWIDGMPRASPDGPLMPQIDGIIEKWADKNKIPYPIMRAAYSYDMPLFRGVKEITKEHRDLQDNHQHQTDKCIGINKATGNMAAARQPANKIAVHLGMSVHDMLMRCQTKMDRMKVLIDIYLMPGEDGTLFTMARSFLGLTEQMPWERLYALRKLHQKSLLIDQDHQTADVRGFEQLLKNSHERHRRQKHKLAAAERQGSANQSNVMGGMAFLRRTDMQHSDLKERLDDVEKLIHKYVGETKSIGLDVSRRFQKEDRVMMKDSRTMEKWSNGILTGGTKHIDRFLRHLRLANASFYKKTRRPVRSALMSLVRFILNRWRLRVKHKIHLRKLMHEMAKQKIYFKYETRQQVHSAQSRAVDMFKKSTAEQLKTTLGKLKNQYLSQKRQLQREIDTSTETTERTAANNARLLKVITQMMKDENETVTKVTEETKAYAKKGSDFHSRITKELQSILTEVNEKIQAADGEKLELKSLEDNMFKSMTTAEDAMFKSEQEKLSNDKFKAQAESDIAQLKAKVEEQLTSMTALEQRILQLRTLWTTVEGGMKQDEEKAYKEMESAQNLYTELNYRVPSHELQERIDQERIDRQAQECQEDSHDVAVKKAVESSEDTVNSMMQDVVNPVASIGSVLNKSCNKTVHASHTDELLTSLGDVSDAKGEAGPKKLEREQVGPPGAIENIHGM